MKILRISLSNIASLAGAHTVDFTKAPLLNAGLFSISGPTGSGKSTLLDALCIALYDDTPRLTVVQGAVAVKDGLKEVQQNDVRNLLRRGCGEGYAEAAFVGVDGLIYTARWTVWRAGGKADRPLQKSEHSLFLGNTEPGATGQLAVSGTATLVKEAIVAKVGLTFDQFRRAVLLAQGDFATFLKAKDAERAEILQALTGTERFEKISIAVFQRNKSEEALVEDLRQKIGSVMPLSEEERALVEEELRSASVLKEDLQRQQAARKLEEEWFVVEARRNKDLEEARSRVRECMARVELDKPRVREMQWIRTAFMEGRPRRAAEKEAKATLDLALARREVLREREGVLLGEFNRAKTIQEAASISLEHAAKKQRHMAGDLARARILDGELVPLEAAAALANKEYDRAFAVFSKAERELASLAVELGRIKLSKDELLHRLSQVAQFEPFARDVDVWLERFKSEAKSRAKMSLLNGQLNKAAEDASKTTLHLQKMAATLPEVRRLMSDSEVLMKKASERVESFSGEDILARRRNALASQAALQELGTHLEIQKRIVEERQACEEVLASLDVQASTESALREELSAVKIPEAQAAFRQAQESLRLAEAAVSEHAVVLRQALVPGEACPVCGSFEHPKADGGYSPEKAVLSALKLEMRSKETVFQKLQADLSGVELLLKDRKKQEEKTRMELKKMESRIKDLEAYAPASTAAETVWKMRGARREAELGRLQEELNEALKTLEEREVARVSAESDLKARREDFEKKRDALLEVEKAEAEARSLSATADAACKRIQCELGVLEMENALILEAIAPVLNVFKTAEKKRVEQHFEFEKYDYFENPEAYLEWYESKCREWNTARQLLDVEGGLEAGKLQQFEPLKSGREAARGVLDARNEEQLKAQGRFSERKAARDVLFAGRPVAQIEAELAAEIESASLAASVASRKQIGAEQALGTLRGLLEEQQKLVVSLEVKQRETKAEMEEWLKEFTTRENRETNRNEVDVWLSRDSQWVEHEQQKLDDAVHQLATARGNEAAILKQCEDHLKARSTMDDLETVRNEAGRLALAAKAASMAADAKRAVVVNDDERKRQTGELRKNLGNQEKQWGPWQKLNGLIGSKDGAKFRNLAQQWTLEILLKHANAQLELLSGRYRVERLRDSLNLMVTDRDMDGQNRSVHSLSGGESFLVSLGLALGLASLTSSRLLIESLFIDEGFGSLDAETLRVALNALIHLEAQGRKVGVISHVGEMVDAIPVQVRVVRTSGGASKIMV